MTTTTHSWIQRQAADQIFERICSKPVGLVIYIINAGAGMGKTYLGRDIGTRLGSPNGYEAGHTPDISWSGIVDLYDPDTSNSKRIEQRWIEAFSSLTGLEFKEYRKQRELYESRADEVSLPSEVEKQINDIRGAFSKGMEKAIQNIYPVMAFDTVERLQMVLDPAQQKLNLEEIDPSDVFDWLLYQVRHLSKGVILMLGRSTPFLTDKFKDMVEDFNSSRKAGWLAPVEIEEISLEYLNQTEQALFFQQRVKEYHLSASLLDENLKNLLNERTQGNPLLMDIALQTLLATHNPGKVRDSLNSAQGIEAVEEALLTAYMHEGSVERQNVLTFLAIARNGLFHGLLKHLAPQNYDKLLAELTRMGDLPFVKVRAIMAREAGQEQPITRLTYFLHDEMYTICDRVPVVGMTQVREESANIVRWYDDQVQQQFGHGGLVAKGRRPESVRDLLVESLPYRLRADPKKGYQWFLDQSNRAIRNSERGFDLRLRDAMSLFMGSAGPKGQTGKLPANAIDREILMSTGNFGLYLDFEMDSALQWIKRYSIRGRHEKALEIARKAGWVEDNFKKNREHYFATYTELRLWLGQSTMYAGKPDDALDIYNQINDELCKGYTPEAIQNKKKNGDLSEDETIRLCQVAGRVYNNRGYLFWMYFGMYWAAQEELFEALRYFELVDLPEEKANTKDNLGRVFTILGFDFQAFEAIGEGLDLRTQAAAEPYREALSLNSRAIAYAHFDNVSQAFEDVEKAINIFEHINIERGKALALTTRGLAKRTKAELWRDLRLPETEALKLVQGAEKDLLDALATFAEIVQEPIREVHIYNEIGCCYRCQVMLLKDKQNSNEWVKALDRGKRYFEMAIELSEKSGFFVEKLDSLQDRAVLYYRSGQFDEAAQDLEKVSRQIPVSHKIQADQGLLVEKTSRVDAYFKLMGQVELLTGAMVFDKANRAQGKPANDVILEMLEHYALAVAYFFTFSGKAFTNRQTSNRIYSRLRVCSREFLAELRDQHVPEMIKKYALPQEAVQGQFDEVFSLLIPGSKGQNWGKSSHR